MIMVTVMNLETSPSGIWINQQAKKRALLGKFIGTQVAVLSPEVLRLSPLIRKMNGGAVLHKHTQGEPNDPCHTAGVKCYRYRKIKRMYGPKEMPPG